MEAALTITLSKQLSRRILLLSACVLATTSSNAANLEVTVVDINGAPVPGVVVYTESHNGPEKAAVSASAVMDQVDTRFVPHVLVVQAGTSVSFPNSDYIAHHVYSFSTPNQFVLPLYKGNLHAPVTFEQSGVVTLGCNIHDDMLGYILVVDSAIFATTDISGKATLDVADTAGLDVRIWSPRFRQGDEKQLQSISAGQSAGITFSLTQKLHDPHEAGSTALAWKDY